MMVGLKRLGRCHSPQWAFDWLTWGVGAAVGFRGFQRKSEQLVEMKNAVGYGL